MVVDQEIVDKARIARERASQVLASNNVWPHQRVAAQHAFDALKGDARAVILAAEMQSGKSGVSLALACLQRIAQPDEIAGDRANWRKDTLFVLTMADNDLLKQAKNDLKPASNVTVTNLGQFEKDLDSDFPRNQPTLIIVDECHYGSGNKSVRYERLFHYLEFENPDCKLAFISATPLSALLATEAESMIRRKFKTRIVFHRASEDYYGVRQMLKAGQVVPLHGRSRSFLNRSPERTHLIELLKAHPGPGWALLRVPTATAMQAKQLLIAQGFAAQNILIVGQSLQGVPPEELISIEDLVEKYEEDREYNEKIIAITVAGCRAGINFGNTMKAELIATWDSTISNVAAVVQANIGRACGYNASRSAVHFTNAPGVRAYAEVLDYLEQTCTSAATDDLDGLRERYEKICLKYEISGLDVGATVRSSGRLADAKPQEKIYRTDSYLVVPGRLHEQEADFSDYTVDPRLLEAIKAIRTVLLKNGGPQVKTSRAISGTSKVAVGWVNGDTYDNEEKAIAGGTYRVRAQSLAASLDNDHPYAFNDVIMMGGGVSIEKKEVSAMVFSIYNASRRKGVVNPCMTQEQLDELADWFEVPRGDTLILLAVRGEEDEVMTQQRHNLRVQKAAESSIVEHNHFN